MNKLSLRLTVCSIIFLVAALCFNSWALSQSNEETRMEIRYRVISSFEKFSHGIFSSGLPRYTTLINFLRYHFEDGKTGSYCLHQYTFDNGEFIEGNQILLSGEIDIAKPSDPIFVDEDGNIYFVKSNPEGLSGVDVIKYHRNKSGEDSRFEIENIRHLDDSIVDRITGFTGDEDGNLFLSTAVNGYHKIIRISSDLEKVRITDFWPIPAMQGQEGFWLKDPEVISAHAGSDVLVAGQYIAQDTNIDLLIFKFGHDDLSERGHAFIETEFNKIIDSPRSDKDGNVYVYGRTDEFMPHLVFGKYDGKGNLKENIHNGFWSTKGFNYTDNFWVDKEGLLFTLSNEPHEVKVNWINSNSYIWGSNATLASFR